MSSTEAFEFLNPSFNDIPLDEQIEYGICDWCAEGISGHQYFGRTKKEAENIRASYNDA